MPQENSKVSEPDATEQAAAEAVAESSKQAEAESADESANEATETVEGAEGASEKKKKSRKRKIKDALSGKGKGEATDMNAPASGILPKEAMQMLLANNPGLANELQGQAGSKAELENLVRKLNLNEMLTGLAPQGSQKDMASHAFWKTQPVPSFDEMASKEKIKDGPIKEIKIEEVDKNPSPMYPGFEWVTMDLEDEKQLHEVFELLTNHYVEDKDATFRFNYSPSFLNWALKAPGWKKEWHVGVRATASGKLVAFISGIPIQMRIREKILDCSEVNFLCIHKKLRSKRLAPVLIKEITRRCYVEGTFQAVYTAGSLLPTPVSTARYFHRALDWQKLHDVGFSPLPPNSTEKRQIIRFKLPDTTSTPGLREMEAKDVDSALDLLQRYLKRMDMAQVFNKTEFEHWMAPKEKPKEQVVWSYVVEDPNTHKITDYFSFYNLESTVIGNKKHNTIKAAYLFYYGTEVAFEEEKDQAKLKQRLNLLMKDALILAKKANFDVFNALTLLDNPLFLDEQRFGAGDGSLHYYLYNYRAAPIPGGIDSRSQASKDHMGGIGMPDLDGGSVVAWMYDMDAARGCGTLTNFADFTKHTKGSACPRCDTPFFKEETNVRNLFSKWLSDAALTLSSTIDCEGCGALCCIYCAQKHPIEPAGYAKYGSHSLSWCCDDGRLFLIWALLCGFDQYAKECSDIEKKRKPSASKSNGQIKNRAHDDSATPKGRHHLLSSGIGYGRHGSPQESIEGPDQSGNQSSLWRLSAQRAADDTGTMTLTLLQYLLPSIDRKTRFDIDTPGAVLEMLMNSKVLSYCAELLRNDQLVDITRRKHVYMSLTKFLETIGSHSSTNEALFSPHIIRPDMVNILTLSLCDDVTAPKEKGPILAACCRNLFAQSSVFLKNAEANKQDFQDDEGQDMIAICREVSLLAELVELNTTSAARDLAVKELPGIRIKSTYKYAEKGAKLMQSPPGRLKRLIIEITTLQTSLPPGIYVRYAEDRPDILKCVITGAVGTPYENGLFEFDIYCNENFPNAPPDVTFKGTGGGKISINPNLSWYPSQAMVLCEEPWYNEPGRETQYRSGKNSPSGAYNADIRKLTVRYALLDWLDKPSSLWQDVVDYHFKEHGNAILQTVEQWAKGGGYTKHTSCILVRDLRRRYSAEQLSQTIAQRFAQKSFTPLELYCFNCVFRSLADTESGVHYWSETTLCRFLELPDALGVGSVIFQMASYLGAFPLPSQAPAILTYEALLKVVTILTERYGAVVKKRGREIWLREIYRSLAIYDKGIRSSLEDKEKEKEKDVPAPVSSGNMGFAVDAPDDGDEGDEDEDDELVLAALDSMDAIDAFKHGEQSNVHHSIIPTDNFLKLVELLLLIAPIDAQQSLSTLAPDLSDTRVAELRRAAHVIISSFGVENHPGVTYRTFNAVISTCLPYLFNGLNPLFEHFLFAKDMDLSKRKGGPNSPTKESKPVIPPPKAQSEPILREPGEILNLTILSQLSFFLKGSDLFRRLRPLYSGNTHGFSMGSFEKQVFNWRAPTILLVKGRLLPTTPSTTRERALQDMLPPKRHPSSITPDSLSSNQTLIYGAYISSQWKHTVFTHLAEGGGSFLPSKLPARKGSDWQDRFEIESLEVWGCGGDEVAEEQRRTWAWEEREAEARRRVNLGTGDQEMDRELLKMAV
ncbi:NMT1 N-myristoyl transferase [Pyrenophora tritici-repentis]|nr:NMT1 N-myristoyl transferase [Pyrenophora tritici-repentis]